MDMNRQEFDLNDKRTGPLSPVAFRLLHIFRILCQETERKSLFVFGIILLLPALTLAQSLNVPIVVQPAEWTGMPVVPTGTRTNAPVSFGIGIPDSAGIDCPGTQDKPQNEGSPTKLELINGSGQMNSQFRCMAKWPSGNAKWVLVDTQLPSFTEGSTGFDASIKLVQVGSGGGNFPPSTMAQQCAGPGIPYGACPDANHIVVQTGAATFLIRENNYNLFDDVQAGSAHLISSLNHGPYDGLLLYGPSHSELGFPTVDSVSCSPGPMPGNYRGLSVCVTPYDSNLDNKSTCTIEENGAVRSVVMCQGDMVSASGDVYMHWRTRTHFWANHSDAKVTVGLRNADVTTGCCTSPSFPNAYKEFTQFEARLTDNLNSPSSRNFDIANDGYTPSTGTISAANGTDKAYLYQAYSQNGEWPHWSDAGNCITENDSCVVSPIPRTGAPGNWVYSANGFQINKNGATITNGGNSQFPVGWADLDDGANGIETGVYQLSMYWPKSLEFQPGVANHNEIRIGIWPNQEEFAGARSATAYAMGWPQYSIHDTYWNFHAGTQTPAAAQNNFLYFQHYLLARPQSGTYYNTVADATSGLPALFYNIPDPVAEDNFYISKGLCSAPAGQCLGDVGEDIYPYQNSYQGMKIFRFFEWQTAGGSDGTQFEQRYTFLRNWLQRGGSGTVGSEPGRYVFASHWYRMIVEKSLPRSDTSSTSGSKAGFRSLCGSLITCDSLSFFPWGDPKNNALLSVWNGGMRNWGDDTNAMEHSVYWGIFDYYFLSGDEWVKEQLLQGLKDRYQNSFTAFNNLSVVGAAPGHGHIPAVRATGHWLSGAARMMEFLRSIGDPDADTLTTVLTSPGTSPGTTTVLQGIEQNLAAQIALPYIASGYPKGWSEPSSVNCQMVSAPSQLCSQGVNPVRGFMRPAVGGLICGQIGGRPPCDAQPHPADASFQTAIWSEGVYDIWLAMRDLLGKDWHLQVGKINDGAMGPLTVTLSEKNLTDMLYASYQQMSEENCVNTGSYSTSGCVYAQFSNYLNSPSGCTSSGDCMRSCVTGCSGLTQWFALAAAAPTTNATVDLSGKSWQFLFESQLKRAGTLNMELGSHMMQFGMNYILADGSTSSNQYAVNPTVPVLTPIPFSVTPNSCVGPSSGTGTCTITWTAPTGLAAVSGVQYRLKYLSCQNGVLTIHGNDCPAGGKTIVPALKFHSDVLTAGFAAPDGSGSWEIDPSRNWNWAFTADVPDCIVGQSSPNCNPDVPSGTSYTFNTQANTTYTFSLSAYTAGTVSGPPPPVVSVASPISGAKLVNTVAILANASSSVGVAGVQFMLNGVGLGSEITAPPYSFNWDTTKTANGTYSLSARAFDVYGNQATSSTVTVTVSNASNSQPQVTITSPTPGAKVLGNVIISANASSSLGIAGVQFQLDGASFGPESLNAPYQVSWNTSKSSNGSHILSAVAFDTAGNHATSATVSLTVSNATSSSPTVSITSPAQGANLAQTVVVSAKASSSVGIAGVQFLLDGVAVGAEVVTAPYSASWNTASANNGLHTLSAVAFDTAGNRGVSTGVIVTISNSNKVQPPTVSFTSPSGGSTVSGVASITATASDANDTPSVQFVLDGVNLGSAVLGPPYAFSWDTTKTSNGAHTLQAFARNSSGMAAFASIVVELNNNSPTSAAGSKALAAIDGLTKFGIQSDELASAIADCSGCRFQSQTDLTPGQTTVVLLRAGASSPTADQIVLRQGVLNGTVTSVGNNQFVVQVLGTPGPSSVLVITTSGVTDYQDFPAGSSNVKAGQIIAIRGLLFKSGPQGGPTILARRVALLSATPSN
jgi:hypothetical protein